MVTSKKFRGSGYAEILLEANLTTTCCLKNILKGKAYAKAIYALKAVSESVQRLLFEKYLEEDATNIQTPMALMKIVQECNRQKLDSVLNDPSSNQLINSYLQYEEKVRNGHLGKTAMFWFSIVDHTCLILMLQYSVKKKQPCPIS